MDWLSIPRQPQATLLGRLLSSCEVLLDSTFHVLFKFAPISLARFPGQLEAPKLETEWFRFHSPSPSIVVGVIRVLEQLGELIKVL